jgi:hypothetical protein
MTSFFASALRGFCGEPEMAEAEERNSRIPARAAPLTTQVLRQVARDSKTVPVLTDWTPCGGMWNFKVDPFLMRGEASAVVPYDSRKADSSSRSDRDSE